MNIEHLQKDVEKIIKKYLYYPRGGVKEASLEIAKQMKRQVEIYEKANIALKALLDTLVGQFGVNVK